MATAGIPSEAELGEIDTLSKKFHDQYEALKKEFATGDGIDPSEAQVLDHLADELRKIRTLMVSVKSGIANASFKSDEPAAAGGSGGGAGGAAPKGGSAAAPAAEEETAVDDEGNFAGNTVGGAPPPGAQTGGAGGKLPKDIGASVGQGGKNEEADVKAVQTALNNHGQKLKVDGKSSPGLVAAIKEFQKAHTGASDGRVDPGGKTWKALSEKPKKGADKDKGGGAHGAKPKGGKP